MTPDEQLDRLDAELTRARSTSPKAPAILRLSSKCLRSCSKWKWEQHGWILSDGQSCAIMNGSENEAKGALLSILAGHMIRKIEFVPGVDVLDVVSDA